MPDGIPIRDLDVTTTVFNTDVIVIDKIVNLRETVTYQISYLDFRTGIFTGDVTLDGDLTVTGDTHLKGDLIVDGDTNLKGDLVVEGDANFKQDVHIEGDLTVDGDTNLKGNVDIGGDLTVEGDTHLKGDLVVDGDANFKQDVHIEGDLTVDGDTNLNGDVNIGGDLTVEGDTHLKGDLVVDGDTTHNGDVIIDGDLVVNGDTNLQLALNDLTDCEVTGAVNGDFLQYDGTNWTRGHLPFGLTVVNQIIAGDNITLDPTGGTGIVTIHSDPGVSQLVAGTNVTLDPADGKGVVTVNASGGVPSIGKLVSGSRITLNPPEGDLTLGDVIITAAGNDEDNGIGTIFDPIYIDLQTPYNQKHPHNNQGNGGDDFYWHFDYYGSEGRTDVDEAYPYLKTIEETPWIDVDMLPDGCNGFFFEVYWKASHISSRVTMNRHPGYLLDEPVHTFMEVRHVTELQDCEFESGHPAHQHDYVTGHLTNKLSPTSIQYKFGEANSRRSKVNFITFNPGTTPKFQTLCKITRYHYTAMWASLGRIKIIPVRMENPPYALEYIRKFIERDEAHALAEGVGDDGAYAIQGHLGRVVYPPTPSDMERLQGDDIRQAVHSLNGSIDVAIAFGGDQAALNNLRQRLKTEVMEVVGGFEVARRNLHAIKEDAVSLGALMLTRFEQDASVHYLLAGDGSNAGGPP